MSLDKAIKSGKEHRKEFGKYKKNYAKSVDYSCRNHGDCIWCKENRLHKFKKSELKSEGE